MAGQQGGPGPAGPRGARGQTGNPGAAVSILVMPRWCVSSWDACYFALSQGPKGIRGADGQNGAQGAPVSYYIHHDHHSMLLVFLLHTCMHT